jgi:hypothetical protein
VLRFTGSPSRVIVRVATAGFRASDHQCMRSAPLGVFPRKRFLWFGSEPSSEPARAAPPWPVARSAVTRRRTELPPSTGETSTPTTPDQAFDFCRLVSPAAIASSIFRASTSSASPLMLVTEPRCCGRRSDAASTGPSVFWKATKQVCGWCIFRAGTAWIVPLVRGRFVLASRAPETGSRRPPYRRGSRTWPRRAGRPLCGTCG